MTIDRHHQRHCYARYSSGFTIFIFALLSLSVAQAVSLDYALKPVKIAQDTYVLIGKLEDFSRQNGGNIVNTGFIVTDAGIIVIDTGPSKHYAEQQRQAIRAISQKPILKVWITHHHPDHFLGNQIYKDVPIQALAGTREGIRHEGDAFTDNLYRLVGDWMRGTDVFVGQETLTPGRRTIGGHDLELFHLQGHTSSDLAIMDYTTGVLFVGDLVFHNRASTTAHANIPEWVSALDRLATLPFTILVPGHGEVAKSDIPIQQTRNYLKWLQRTFYQAAQNGLDMTEVMRLPIADRFKGMALVRSEFMRSVSHLYPAMEQGVLKSVSPAQ